MPHLAIAALQSLQVILDGRRVTNFRSVRAQALLIYLAVEADRPHPRELLAGLLWPDKPEHVARHNLGQTLVNLRRAIGDHAADPPFLLISRKTIQFNPASDHQLDVSSVHAHLQRCRKHEHAELSRCAECAAHLEQLVDLYRGPFLAEFALNGSDLFDEWMLLKREWLHVQVFEALERLTAYYLWRREYNRAERAARRLVALEPLSEMAQRELMRALALSGQRSAALAQFEACRRMLAEQLQVAPAVETRLLYDQIRDASLAARIPTALPERLARHDWGQAPEPRAIYGREHELLALRRWLGQDQCRLVAILGIGGIGKTTLAIRAAQEQADGFDCVFWRSLLNAPPLTELLPACLRLISGDGDLTLPDDLDAQLQLLLSHLRARRCLIMLDNVESLFEAPGRQGQYRPGYAAYGQLFQAVAAGTHQSCLLLTGRENPRELSRLADEQGPVRVLRLSGLHSHAGREILRSRCDSVGSAEVAAIVTRYSGNPLALHLVAETISEFYAGDASSFLHDEALIFDDIRDVLDQQFDRLTSLERETLYWLMIVREPYRPDELRTLLFQSPGRSRELEALRSLQQRSLLEKNADSFTLQHVVMEYLADRCVAEICQEIVQHQPAVLARHALLLARAPEYIRESQRRMLLAPIAERLLTYFGPDQLDIVMRRLFDQLRTMPTLQHSYAAGNLLNLALQAGLVLRGYDVSHLAVRQAYLRGVSLPEVNFRGADLSSSVFTDSFSFVTAMAISPDGTYLAAATGDTNIRLWEVASGQLIDTYTSHSDFVWEMAFSSDGTLLASASWDKTVGIWDTRTGRVVHRLSGHSGRVRAVAFAPDGSVVASAGEDRTIRLWNAQDGTVVRVMNGHVAAIRAVHFCHKGKLLASGGEDDAIHLWDTRSGQVYRSLPGHRGGVWSLAFSPDNRVLASSGEDRSVRLWHIGDGHLHATLDGHSGAVWKVAYSPDGTTIASGGEDRTVRIYDVATMSPRHVLRGHTEGVWAVAYSPDGAAIASGGEDQTVRVWDVRSGRPHHSLQGYTNWIYALVYSPDATMLASGNWDGMLRLWDRAGQLRATLAGHCQRVRSLAYSPDGMLLASGSEDQTICLWHPRDGRLQRRLCDHQGWVRALCFDRAGQRLFSASMDGSVKIWDLTADHAPYTLSTSGVPLTSLALNRAEDLLVAGGNEGSIVIWDLAAAAVMRRIAAHEQAVNDVLIGTDGNTLISASADQTLRCWDLPSGTLRYTFSGHTSWIWALALAPDGTTLASASADQSVRLWDIGSGVLLHTLHGHSNWVRAVAFASDGTLASGGVDELIKIWDITSGECRATLRTAGPYAGSDITGATGLAPAQRSALHNLGAIEDAPE